MTLPLAYLRGIQQAYLPDTATIQRATEGTPTGDGTPTTWPTIATVACRVSPIASGANEQVGGGGAIQAVNQWIIRVPALQDVTVKDRVAFGARTFEIVRVDARSYETVRDLICREIT